MRGQERFFTLDYSGLVRITLDYSGSQRRPEKGVIVRVGVPKEGSLVSSAAMRRGHTALPPVPAVPPSQTNDGKGFLWFKPSQRRPKSSSSGPKGCGGVLLHVFSGRSAVEAWARSVKRGA